MFGMKRAIARQAPRWGQRGNQREPDLFLPRAAPFEPAAGPSGRVTRASTHAAHAAARAPRKVKVKLGTGQAQNATTSVYPPGNSFLGPYDRELDSSDEDLAFEEQFVLRVPEEGGLAEEVRKRVQRKEVGDDVWFKFKDSRRAVFHVGAHSYPAKLVDLPSIIESQKTLDGKQMYKVADICQMLLVEPERLEGTERQGDKSFNIDEFIYPHGITPPLRWARRRRFRKRINKMTIETVEQEVERLLEQDAKAVQVEFDVLENVDPDMSDSEFEPRAFDAATPASGMGEEDGYGEPLPGEESEEDEMDMELAAEIDRAFEEEGRSESDEEGGRDPVLGGSETETGSDEEEYEEEYDSEDEEGDEEEEEEDAEDAGGERQRRRLLAEEIADLERACERKAAEVARAGNPVIKKRLEDVLGKLERDLEMRRAQREEMRRGREERRRAAEEEEREEAERKEREEKGKKVDVPAPAEAAAPPDQPAAEVKVVAPAPVVAAPPAA
ncbi:hypothetical protein CALVIDRAFT_551594 [Calocera viscosa TUFC12733]|uniref:TAFII55 protein conserved region domain-containing protein n=1 Tax=Calocera viscosa (strain TUFC12733) TaxID=1330018 RepID=A0A167GG21_CALVF|nr:hypothetical protein CALVIDRAFT_551594 [Calocera viscosa TUFC12733]